MPAQFAPYRKLARRARDIAFIHSSSSLLSWDTETYLPPKGVPYRAEQLAYLNGQAHRLFTAKSVGACIAACEEHGFDAGSDEAANVREWRRSYDRATKVPARLVEALARARTLAREAWRQARQQSEFALFRPHLQKILEINLKLADCWGYQESPYDALLDEYEPGVRASQLKTLFAELQPAIVSVLNSLGDAGNSAPPDLLRGHYPVAAQQALNREVAAALGFDFDAGRVDTTTHPFCSTHGPADCRLTTRYNEEYFTNSFYGILHEAGHGMYEQGLTTSQFGAPLGTAASLGMHESQSRLWENHVGRSQAFWEHWHPRACEHFPDLKKFTPAQIAASVNRVSPSFIRVEADQVTYDLHIILRFGLEVRLIEGQLTPHDVPTAWNEEFEKMFGLKVAKDSDGCLQDIHWSSGTIGYFPTYTLGNLNAAQLMGRAMQDLPGLDGELARGQYGSLLGWLRDKVHRHGQRWKPGELMQRATGEATSSTYHVNYLRKKFLGA